MANTHFQVAPRRQRLAQHVSAGHASSEIESALADGTDFPDLRLPALERGKFSIGYVPRSLQIHESVEAPFERYELIVFIVPIRRVYEV
jgi:hypothetical protein